MGPEHDEPWGLIDWILDSRGKAEEPAKGRHASPPHGAISGDFDVVVTGGLP